MTKTRDVKRHRKDPIKSNVETLAQLQAPLTRTAQTIEDRREAFFADPDDIETIHRFRTNARTLRSLVAFIKPWQDAEQNSQTQTILRDVVRYTSLLRELDVFERQVRADQESSPELQELCAAEASAERAKVLKALGSKRVTKQFNKAMSLAKRVTWKKRYAKSGLPASVVRARFDALVTSVEAELAAVDLADDELTHDVRKRAKRVRYVAEHNADILGTDAKDIAKGMKAQQDTLGDVCDARANIRLIDGLLGRDLPEPARRDLIRMRAQNEAFLHQAT